MSRTGSAEEDPGRERKAVSQLGAVCGVRQRRLLIECAALDQRERALGVALARQAADEALLHAQRTAWRQRWQLWAREGGSLGTTAALRRDHELLRELGTVLEGRRAALRCERERLDDAWCSWRRRERAAQALAEALHERGEALRRSTLCTVERGRDEEALALHVARRNLPGALAV